MSAFRLTYKAYGKSAILIEWPSRIDKNILHDIVLFKNKIIQNNTKQIVDVINTYCTLTVIYHSAINIIYDDVLALKALYQEEISLEIVKNYRWEIPVCYDKKFGIDLEELEEENDLTHNQIINLHSASIYTVYFIGFVPGFLYLGGLDKKLHIPRKSNPRLRVEKGAVAIGGGQTGIYPAISAGGWHIIGNTPVSTFNSKLEEPCFAKSGDEIKFMPIDMGTYRQMESKVLKGTLKLKKSEI